MVVLVKKIVYCGTTILDEFPEFERRVIESLRQPLEEQTASIARVRSSLVFPADFILVAAMNPCPCGNYGHPRKECVCSAHERARYSRKISGPILDRIDIFLPVGPVAHEKLTEVRAAENENESAAIRGRVAAARHRQKARAGVLNGRMTARHIAENIRLSSNVKQMLDSAARACDLSARAYHKVIKLARTIADMTNARDIGEEHVMEALSYRERPTA